MKAISLLLQPGIIIVPKDLANPDTRSKSFIDSDGETQTCYYILKRKSWLMGDPLTKILLTFA